MTELYRRFRFHHNHQQLVLDTNSYFDRVEDLLLDPILRLGASRDSALKPLDAEKSRQLAIAQMHAQADINLPAAKNACQQARDDYRTVEKFFNLVDPQFREAVKAAKDFYDRQLTWTVLTLLLTNVQLAGPLAGHHDEAVKLATEYEFIELDGAIRWDLMENWLNSALESNNANDVAQAQKLKDLQLF